MSETDQKTAFATGVPPDIYAFHHYTGNSTFLYLLSSPVVLDDLSQLSREISRPTYQTTCTRFTPSKSG